MKLIFSVLSFCLLMTSCNQSVEKKAKTETSIEKKEQATISNVAPAYIQEIEIAHHKKDFLAKANIKFHINVLFGGKERLDADMVWATNSSKGVISFADGNKIYVDGGSFYYPPNFANEATNRFNAYTWPYFFMMPFKLSDEGTQWSAQRWSHYDQLYNTQKLTFQNGTGDTADDWYFIHSDQESNLIIMAAYIVTAGKTLEEAEAEPHAVRYDNYYVVDGIPLADKWTFWNWNEDEGLKKKIGEVSLTEIDFVDMKKDFFEPPMNFIKKE